MGLLCDYGLVLLLSEGSVRVIYGFESLCVTTLPVVRLLDRGDDRRDRVYVRAMQGLGLASIALPLAGGVLLLHTLPLSFFFFLHGGKNMGREITYAKEQGDYPMLVRRYGAEDVANVPHDGNVGEDGGGGYERHS